FVQLVAHSAPAADRHSSTNPPDLNSSNRLQRPAMRTHPHPETPFRAEALRDLAIGIDAGLSGEIDGPVWSVSDRGTAGALDRVAQMADRKHCRSHARPFRLGFLCDVSPRRCLKRGTIGHDQTH